MTTTISPACLLLDALTAAGIRTACDFDPADLSVRDPECFARLVSNAAYFLSAPVAEGLEDECPDDDEAEESAPDAFEPLSLEIYRAGRGGYIADVDLTVGGPTIRARYESRWERLTLTASWGAIASRCLAMTARSFAGLKPPKSLTASNPHKPAPPHRWGAYESARASGRFHLQNRRGFFQLIS